MKELQQISIPESIIGGVTICPSFVLPLQTGAVTGIYSDVEHIDYIVQQLQHHQQLHLHFRKEGYYERLTVMENLKFEQRLYDSNAILEDILKLTGLMDKKRVKMKDLSDSQLQRVRLAKLLIHEKTIHILEEPFQNLDIETKRIVDMVVTTLKEKGCTVYLLTNNLEGLLISSDQVYRLDAQGLQPLDLQEEPTKAVEGIETESRLIKLEKIPTKLNDKFILFNPPEIDYIESVDGLINVYVAGDAFPCTLTLNELEQRLLVFGFFRCHRSYIVNLQKVREIVTWTKNSYSLILSGNDRTHVPLSKSKLVELKKIVGI
ncbi:LytTR family transcriptional regulator DNA-binding domain-containing protein [Viridibacillus sp. YIM B01967]|uniref:LytTR family transcriptional regulator DNA-binding domain-containing protein n=1 Tax=Viridibacillus soli TaxID=2798301 RepID=A0ABS1H9L7_9BACL|nr:LytTR family transcriptional regulator DNA-binding domain-containing protein [Viridibacillus soli]MBK3496110.1 LytTR family transcriptional regulator DNA-binding domain-containing protein [Viridibacillus soli]